MNIERRAANPATEQTIDLRAHHLYTLASLESFKAHKRKSREKLVRQIKSEKLRLLGYGNAKNFLDHLVDSLLAILNKEISTVRIVSMHDAICEKCTKKEGDHCKVGGIKWSKNFLKSLDEAIVRNTRGLLQINGSYPPDYLLKNLPLIKKAIRKTLLEIPGLWMRDKKSPHSRATKNSFD